MTPIDSARHTGRRRFQRGGFFLGLIVGLLMGLAVALGVALYVTKVPVPFLNKVPQRSAELDAAQAEKNRNWDPNAALSGKSPVRTPAPAAPTLPPGAAPTGAAPVVGAKAPQAAAAEASAVSKKEGKTLSAAADNASPPAEPAPLTYFVQAGAFARSEDAEQQRANLALLGLTPKITEREQAGRAVFRVRIGPYERKEDADAAKEKLAAAGIDSALVRVQR